MRLPTRQIRAALAAAVLLPPLAAPSASAQPARLLADVSDRPLDVPHRLILPPYPVVLDGVVYFSHDDGVAGNELWRSDGTSEGTWRVRDICPGRCWAEVSELTIAGGRLYFQAADGVHGSELWSSDGTEAGTRLIADIAPGLGGSRPAWITAFGERVFFSADDGLHGREPWITDGTAEGTRRLGDLRMGGDGSMPSDPLALGTKVLFLADDGVHGREPWITDGTPEGTELVLDVRDGPLGSTEIGPQPVRFPTIALFDGKAWFPADDGAHGRELWASDGSAGGTGMAADLWEGPAGSGPGELIASSDRLYFRAHEPSVGDELFATDGQQTALVLDVEPGLPSSHPRPVAVWNDELIFTAHVEGLGRELWASDGSVGGTRLLVDVEPGPGSGTPNASLWPGLPIGDRLFFGNGPGLLLALWTTDGTPEGTRPAIDVPPDEAPWVGFFTFAPPVALGARLFFFAGDLELGWEPWISDGTGPGTHVVRDVYSTPGSQRPFFDLDSSFPIDAGGRLYFVGANWESFAEPWTSRGTPESTRQVAETLVGDGGAGYAWPVAPLGTRLLLFVRAGDHEELWVTAADGTDAEVLQEVEWSGGFGTSFAGRAFFDVTEGRRTQLWMSDGTPAGTGRFVDSPGVPGNWPPAMAEAGGRLYFLGDDALWSTDGTPAGTFPIEPETAPAIALGDMLVASGDRLFFTARLGDSGSELWTSDGTDGGTLPLPEVRPGPEAGFIDRLISGNPRNFTLVPLAGGVVFVGDEGVRGEEPWWSDGTGVAAVGDLRSGERGSEPRWLTATGDAVFFAADDGVHGRELWRWRPGEAAALVADLVPGPGSSLPQELAAADGLLYFAAFTPEHGVELWRSDGTAAGTVRVQDVWPGAESSTPASLTVSGRFLYFTADDGVHGREMWSLLLPTRRPRAFLTAGGALSPGGRVVLTLRLDNPPPEELPDGDGDELVLPLPDGLRVVELTATSGEAAVVAGAVGAAAVGPRVAAAAAGGETVTWNGSLPPGGSVEVRIVAEAVSPPEGGVALQAAGAFDADGDGSNETAFVSDDPSLPGEDDATLLAFAVAIPAMGPGGAMLLALALAAGALHRLRRRPA